MPSGSGGLGVAERWWLWNKHSGRQESECGAVWVTGADWDIAEPLFVCLFVIHTPALVK